jgi:hypothetical protein
VRHVKKRHSQGCGVAAVAMAAQISYTQALSYCPKQDYNLEGLWFGQVVTALRKATKPKRGNRWKTSKYSVPVHFRHWTPKYEQGIAFIVRITPGGYTFQHFIAFKGNNLYDPDSNRRVHMSDAKRNRDWREWLIVAEVGRNG